VGLAEEVAGLPLDEQFEAGLEAYIDSIVRVIAALGVTRTGAAEPVRRR
jgi:hypothetical protein